MAQAVSGSHLVKRLVDDGYWVRGVDIKHPEWTASPADEFLIGDLRDPSAAVAALKGGFDEVYQLAADMGGMGFIHSAETQIMHNSMLVNVNMVEAAAQAAVDKYFLASSVCVYRDMDLGEAELTEDDARTLRYQTMNTVGRSCTQNEQWLLPHARVAFRPASHVFQNCYGPEGTWTGGREKAPAALCRKVAESTDGTIDVWGDGSAVRSFIYVTDLVDGVRRLVDRND